MLLVNIHTAGKWSGRRVVEKVRRKKRDIDKVTKKIIWYYRVTLQGGKTISVDNVEILKDLKKEEK